MARNIRIFYAFPGKPAGLAETIRNAIDGLRSERSIKRDRVRFTPWTDMNVSGKQLINNILENIDRSDVFACDLTYPNSNVSFELGYAIGRFKRIWISLDTSNEFAEQRYRRLYYGLLGLGYIPYSNSTELAKVFLQERPDQDLEQTLLGDVYRNPSPRQEIPVLLYVKPPHSTETVTITMNTLYGSRFGHSLIVDDPVENPSATLEWYANNIAMADAVLCHLLGDQTKDMLTHNVKCSLVAGLSRALRKDVLMLAQRPYDPPVDYRGLLDLHDTANECKVATENWMEKLRDLIPARRRRRPEPQSDDQQIPDLRSLAIGEFVAENERQRIDRYFVETSTYYRAMDDPVTIVIGRKGTGKSAQLYAMDATLRSDRRNHVCIIKPVDYEIEGLIRVLRSIIDKSERGYLVESLWKFLIYSEMGRNLYQALKSRPPFHMTTEEESSLLRFYDDNEFLLRPYSERLDVTIRSFVDFGENEGAVQQREKISELLHHTRLRELREILGKVLSSYNSVHILIDNLDAQWGSNVENIEYIAELLWGLLQVTDDIASEFRIEDFWRKAANVKLTVFIRSDIFALVQPTAPEQDKLPIQRIIWEDPDILKRIVDLRFQFGAAYNFDPDYIWEQLFPDEVVGLPIWEFVNGTVLPRPRDVVYLMREAIDGAINRGHQKVTPQDFLDARGKYSEFVLRSILAEDDPRKGRLGEILYEFAGCPKAVTRSDIEERFEKAGVDSVDYEFYIDLLCDVNFLAISSISGYQYAKHESDREIKRRVAMQVAKSRNIEETYQVSSAFWNVLQIE